MENSRKNTNLADIGTRITVPAPVTVKDSTDLLKAKKLLDSICKELNASMQLHYVQNEVLRKPQSAAMNQEQQSVARIRLA